ISLGDGRRAGLELVRQVVPRRLLELYRADHLAAHLKRRHRLKQLSSPPESAGAPRPAQLVRGEAEEVTAECLDVHRAMRNGLGGVDDDDRALLVGPGG